MTSIGNPLAVTVAVVVATAGLIADAAAAKPPVWRVEREGRAQRLCTPKRVFPEGTSFLTVCASGDRKHWRPIFSAEIHAYWAAAPTDVRGVPDPQTIEMADFTGVRVRLRHKSRLRGSITFNGSLRWRSGCCGYRFNAERWWTNDGGRSWYHRYPKPRCFAYRRGPAWYRWPSGEPPWLALPPWPALKAKVCVFG